MSNKDRLSAIQRGNEWQSRVNKLDPHAPEYGNKPQLSVGDFRPIEFNGLTSTQQGIVLAAVLATTMGAEIVINTACSSKPTSDVGRTSEVRDESSQTVTDALNDPENEESSIIGVGGAEESDITGVDVSVQRPTTATLRTTEENEGSDNSVTVNLDGEVLNHYEKRYGDSPSNSKLFSIVPTDGDFDYVPYIGVTSRPGYPLIVDTVRVNDDSTIDISPAVFKQIEGTNDVVMESDSGINARFNLNDDINTPWTLVVFNNDGTTTDVEINGNNIFADINFGEVPRNNPENTSQTDVVFLAPTVESPGEEEDEPSSGAMATHTPVATEVPLPTATPTETPIPMGLHTPEEGPTLWNGEEIPAQTSEGDFVEIDGELFLQNEDGEIISRLVEAGDASIWEKIANYETHDNSQTLEGTYKEVTINFEIETSTGLRDEVYFNENWNSRTGAEELVDHTLGVLFKAAKRNNEGFDQMISDYVAVQSANGVEMSEFDAFAAIYAEAQNGGSWDNIEIPVSATNIDGQEVMLRLSDLKLVFFWDRDNQSPYPYIDEEDVYRVNLPFYDEAGNPYYTANFGMHTYGTYYDEAGRLVSDNLTLFVPVNSDRFAGANLGYSYINAMNRIISPKIPLVDKDGSSPVTSSDGNYSAFGFK